ncbi:oxidoreductase [Rhizodiscina lignyota]|uniref:Oxidoreductase n=1 Tax=Rhizodiscina lignyota TaxID=1504668 RepID=A0A9P4I4T5_9PEZI|nr:oxidoreductase [Rhizodiscina lignyota]
MLPDKIKLFVEIFRVAIPFLGRIIIERIQASYHRWTYKAIPSPKNVVIVGGSFAGFELAKRLCESLPTGYRVVLVEKNSHLHYVFAFPRFSVVSGYEKGAFIPYSGIARNAPKGIFQLVQDEVVRISDDSVILASGEELPYEYLTIATGTSQLPPAKLSATHKEEACKELQTAQENIQNANSIAVVGGGAVGIEMATDIKSFRPEKDVTLINSRDHILPQFGPRLQSYALGAIRKQNIKVILGERPQIVAPGSGELRFGDGQTSSYDLIIRCTGQTPNSGLIMDWSPQSVSKETKRILVDPNLRLENLGDEAPHVFAVGDVAETGAPKMGRAGHMQAAVVASNIVKLIQGKPNKLEKYVSNRELEGATKLTLGKAEGVIYITDGGRKEILVPFNRVSEDMDIRRVWGMFGVKFSEGASSE